MQPQALRFTTNSAIVTKAQKQKTAPTKHTLSAKVFTCGKGRRRIVTQEVEVRSRAKTEVILKTTPGHVQEFKVTRRYTYNIKYKRPHRLRSNKLSHSAGRIPTTEPCWPDGLNARREKKHICKSAPTFSINVLDALIWLTDSHSSKSRCPELSLPTSGWCMWIICVFSEINTWCCQSKQTNIVVLSEVTETCKFLLKTHRNQRLYRRD